MPWHFKRNSIKNMQQQILDPQEQILELLGQENLTVRQLTRILNPNQYQYPNGDESTKSAKQALERIRHHIKKLRGDNLIVGDAYGKGEEYLYRLINCKTIRALSLTPQGKTDRHFYEHEKKCGNVFTALTLTGLLESWEGTKTVGKKFRPDRTFRLRGAHRRQHRQWGRKSLPPCFCGTPAHGRGLCKTHYARQFRQAQGW